MITLESALAVLVPEAEALVASDRAIYDPSAARGMPAHITLLYPFVAPDSIDDGVLHRLRSCFVGFARFDFALTMTRRFPDRTLYLAIEPEEPFRLLTLAIWQAFPEHPPYGGRYPTIVPHLTIADRQQPSRLDEIDREFDKASQGKLPIRAHAAEVTLLDTESGRWQRRDLFSLG
jgi:2'-5' RNA ligase